jgi:lipopolysaccharide transport system permease protein
LAESCSLGAIPAAATAAPESSGPWTRVIRPPRGLVGLDVHELWRFRELLVFLVWRNVLIRYKQTVIGVAWAVVQPLLTMVVFTVVFGTLAKLPSEGAPYAVLTFAAVLPWQFFSNGLTSGSNSVVNAANMVRKVYFPRLFIPLGDCLSGSLDFAISVALLIVLMLWYDVAITWSLLWIPVFGVVALLTALGPSLWLSALNAKYRDVKYVVPFLVQAGVYVSPVGFSSSIVPERWLFWYHLNPLVGVIDGFRWAVLGPAFTPEWRGFALSMIIVAVVLLSGLAYFRKAERTFADVI